MSGLVVLEGKWSKRYNTSIKSLFDVLIDIKFDSPHHYHFDTFANYSSFRAIVRSVCGRHSQKRYIYIGAHGTNDGFSGSVGSVSRTQLRNCLNDVGGQIRGIFLGSCFFGNQQNAEFLFEAGVGIPGSVRWIAGYDQSVDWIDSSVLDLLFWNTLFDLDQQDMTPNQIIIETCQKITQYASGLVEKWGFKVFTRTPGPGAALNQLMNV